LDEAEGTATMVLGSMIAQGLHISQAIELAMDSVALQRPSKKK
jgi:hypothetical protein